MHLEKPYLTTTKYTNKNKKVAKTAAQRKAAEEHAAWLKKQGLDKDTLQKKKANIKPVKAAPILEKKNSVPLSNNLHVDGGRKFSIMDLVFSENESQETKEAIVAKASRTAPAYSKGAYQYISPGTDLVDIGKKK